MNGLTWFWPGVFVSVVVSLFLAAMIARALGTRRSIAWLLVLSLGVILAATLTPIHGPLGLDTSELRPCDLSRRWFASPADLEGLNDVSLNITLFVPFGFAVGLLPMSRRTLATVVAAIGLPFAIEALQYLIPTLARGCQSGDVIDNLTGLIVGLGTGTVIGWVVSRLRRRSVGSRGGATRI